MSKKRKEPGSTGDGFLPEAFLERLQQMLGPEEYARYLDSLEDAPAASLRINTLKWTRKEAEQALPFLEEDVPWVSGGKYFNPEARPSRSPAYFAGLYYIQEASAMTPGDLLPISPGDRILDLCAAPGGKSTQLAARMAGTGVLYSNDISASRAQALLKNLEMAGAARIFVTAETPEKLREKFPRYFDGVLTDVPCSGEGMFRRNNSMTKDWHARGPAYYQPLQREILTQAADLVAPGGYLLYSTCTFSREENEDNIQWLLSGRKDFSLIPLPERPGFSPGLLPGTVRLWPHHTRGEGHFVALLRKQPDPSWEGRNETGDQRKRMLRPGPTESAPRTDWPFEDIAIPACCRDCRLVEKKDSLYLLPEGETVHPGLRYLRTGLLAGTKKKDRMIPSQALAMALRPEEVENQVIFPWGDERVLRYLKGETIDVEGARIQGQEGMALVMLDHFPLGWAIRQGTRCKNKYNPGWRCQ